jgi:hypothetical protein
METLSEKGVHPDDHTSNDIFLTLLDLPDPILRACGAQILPSLSVAVPSFGTKMVCPLFNVLQWHEQKYPDMPAPSEDMIYPHPDWLARIMDHYLRARAVWTEEDIADFSKRWSQQAHSRQCGECKRCLPCGHPNYQNAPENCV